MTSAPRTAGWQLDRKPTGYASVLLRIDDNYSPILMGYWDGEFWLSPTTGNHLSKKVIGWIRLDEAVFVLDRYTDAANTQ